jgi:polar amino acid transport system permease protein
MSSWAALWHEVLAYWPQILGGLGSTVLLSATVTVTGLIGGVVVFSLTLSPKAWCRRLTEGYISLFIGTPLLVFLFLMYYGLPQWGFHPSPLGAAILGFTANVSAYNARYLASAYNGMDPHEREAARAQGFSGMQILGLITLPQVLRMAIPSLTNQAIQNVKDSSVVFLIQYTEFFSQMQEVALRNFEFFKTYLAAGAVYLLLVTFVVLASRRLERTFVLP